jgi:hypothetical protein
MDDRWEWEVEEVVEYPSVYELYEAAEEGGSEAESVLILRRLCDLGDIPMFSMSEASTEAKGSGSTGGTLYICVM